MVLSEWEHNNSTLTSLSSLVFARFQTLTPYPISSLNLSSSRKTLFCKGIRNHKLAPRQMESQSPNTHGGPIAGIFPYRREEPGLPKGYSWWKEKELFCPKHLLVPEDTIRKDGTIETKQSRLERYHKQAGGLVFCHRGLYERASTIIENSTSALENGTRQGYHLHELDAFVWAKLDEAFMGHDQVADRITAKSGPWQQFTFQEVLRTLLVSRGVDTFVEWAPQEGEARGSAPLPTFSDAYEKARDRVLGVLDAFWHNVVKNPGRTVQLDLREHDLAKAIPHYCFHISKMPNLRPGVKPHGAHETLIYKMFESTMWKGYNIHFSCFEKLEKAIREHSVQQYGADFFERRHLLLCPPLIMVFFSDELVTLAKNTVPIDNPKAPRTSYEHIRRVAMKAISSFVGIDVGVGIGPAHPRLERQRPARYNFVLEIGYSGLGLGYDVKTKKAINPLTGKPIKCPEVVFDSLVDRALIDVAVELREKYPGVLLASCTRMPDVITTKGNFKASFMTAKLGPWPQGEKGIANELRAIHGGLYPQSDIVVADNPAAEIAARVWIDKKLRLDRKKLLNGPPYYEWVKEGCGDKLDYEWAKEGGGGDKLVEFLQGLNTNFAANTVGKSRAGVPVAITPSKTNDATIRSWEDAAAISPSTSRTTKLPVTRQDTRNLSDTIDDDISPLGITVLGSRGFVKSDPPEARRAIAGLLREAQAAHGSGSDSGLTRKVQVRTAGQTFTFSTVVEARRSFANLQIYEAAWKGDSTTIQKLLVEYKEADLNAWAGLWGTPLGAACCQGEDSVVKLLLQNGAQVNPNVAPTPLEAACQCGRPHPVKTRDPVKTRRDLVKTLLGKGAYPNGTLDIKTWARTHPLTPLLTACSNGDLDIVKMLLEHRANPNTGMSTGQTPLGAACAGDHTEIVSTLMRRLQTTCNIKTYMGHLSVALQHACAGPLVIDFDASGAIAESRDAKQRAQKSRDALIAKLLSDNPNIINLYEARPHGTALMAACNRGYLPTVQLLLDRGAQIEISRSEAIHTGSEGEGRIRAGENTHRKATGGSQSTGTKLGRTPASDGPLNPLHEAIRDISPGPIPGQSTTFQRAHSALVVASKHGHLSVVRLLLKCGANPNFRPDEGFTTALEEACGRRDGMPIAKELIAAKANVNLGRPLFYACVTRNEELVDLLLRNGARVNFSIARKDFATPEIISRLALAPKTGNEQYDLEARLARSKISGTGFARGTPDYSKLPLPYHMKGADPVLKRLTPRLITKKRPSDKQILPVNEPSWNQDVMDKRKYYEPVPSCGCLICLLDDRLESGPNPKYSSQHNPVTHTLSGMDLRQRRS